MSRIYMSYDPEQRLLLPQDLREWLPEEHLGLFVSDVVEQLDLSKIMDWYERGDGRRRPPYHPEMMVKLLQVTIYGSKLGENASKHKAMSYDRMCAKEEQLETEVVRLLQEAAATDEREDQEFGKGRRCDE